MNKKLILISLLLVAVLFLGGCSLLQDDTKGVRITNVLPAECTQLKCTTNQVVCELDDGRKVCSASETACSNGDKIGGGNYGMGGTVLRSCSTASSPGGGGGESTQTKDSCQICIEQGKAYCTVDTEVGQCDKPDFDAGIGLGNFNKTCGSFGGKLVFFKEKCPGYQADTAPPTTPSAKPTGDWQVIAIGENDFSAVNPDTRQVVVVENYGTNEQKVSMYDPTSREWWNSESIGEGESSCMDFCSTQKPINLNIGTGGMPVCPGPCQVGGVNSDYCYC